MAKTIEHEILKVKRKKSPALGSDIIEGIKLNQKMTKDGLTSPYERKIYSSIRSLKY